jgi:hypothetical protein
VTQHGSEPVLILNRVRHRASTRTGWAVAPERRYRTPGLWVVWDGPPNRRGGKRPSWHPTGSLLPILRDLLTTEDPT